MSEPTAAVCVGFRARNEHDERVWDWCRRRWEALLPEYAVFVGDSGSEKYNRSASHNAAAKQADGCDVLILVNSDTTFQRASDVRDAVELAAAGTWSLSANYVETSRGYWEVVQHENPADGMPDPLSSYERQLPNSPAGPQIVRADWFADVGGFDEAYADLWGHEDASLRDALDTLHGPHSRVGCSIHLYHPRTAAERPGGRNAPNRIRWATKYRRAARQGSGAMRALVDSVKSQQEPLSSET